MDRGGKVVLVTGASRGIGLACAELFASRGWKVYAGFRKRRAKVPGCSMVRLDVCSSASIRGAVRIIARKEGRLDALVNNAGFGLMGALEDLDERGIRLQMDTNAIGPMLMTKEALPLLRRSKGRIINISSLIGKVALPFSSVYAASKFAVEGLSDALRLELAPQGVSVVVVEPGPIRTNFTATSGAFMRARKASPYAGHYAKRARFSSRANAHSLPPGLVADAVVEAAESARPKARYVVAAGPFGLAIPAKRLLPDSVFDWLVGRMFGMR